MAAFGTVQRAYIITVNVIHNGYCPLHLFTELNGPIIYQSIPAAPRHPPPGHPPPRATVGHLPALSVPGVGHLQILHCQGARHLPTPGATPSFCHALSFLSEYDYTEDFTRKTSRLAHLSRMGKN